MTFPPIDVLERFATCEITIEDIAVTEQENGSYTINKKNFTVSFSMRQTTTSYNYCTHSGIIIATGNAEITLSLIQSSAMGNKPNIKQRSYPPDSPIHTKHLLQTPTIVTFTQKPLNSSTFIWGATTWNTSGNINYESIVFHKIPQQSIPYISTFFHPVLPL